ncbi:MAG: phage holin family protein [Jiangellaceae bacterium]|nr:phage holin family protein [Jiangellaceae bacterium]
MRGGYARGVQLLLRLVVNGIALWVATAVIDGVDTTTTTTRDQVLTIAAVAVVFGLVNLIVKPIVKLLSLPLYIITLGLFTLVVNALMLLLTSWIAGKLGVPFEVDGFWDAVLGGLVISVVSWLLNVLLPD